MSPFLLERLYNHLGKPRGYWAIVMFVLFVVVPAVGAAIDGALL